MNARGRSQDLFHCLPASFCLSLLRLIYLPGKKTRIKSFAEHLSYCRPKMCRLQIFSAISALMYHICFSTMDSEWHPSCSAHFSLLQERMQYLGARFSQSGEM